MARKWVWELILPLVSMAVLVTDQFTKLWVRTNLTPGQPVTGDGLPRLNYVQNMGSAFGLLTNQVFLIVVAVAVIIGSLFIYYRWRFFGSVLARVGMGLVLAGALGNLIDRLRYGYVIDFIDFVYWPVFNAADTSIVVGVIILVYVLLKMALAEGRATKER